MHIQPKYNETSMYGNDHPASKKAHINHSRTFLNHSFYQNLGNVRQPLHPFQNPVAQNISLCYNNCAGCVLLWQASSHNF